MAKRKSPRTTVPGSARSPKRANRSAAKKAPATKRPAKRAATRAKKAAPPKTTVKRKRPAAKRPAAKRPAVLARPKVPGTAELDQLFLKDYEARQVFEFLGVKTVKELEAHPPHEIIERLTGPLVQTVERIRKALAVNNRCLAGDQQFAIQFCQQIR